MIWVEGCYTSGTTSLSATRRLPQSLGLRWRITVSPSSGSRLRKPLESIGNVAEQKGKVCVKGIPIYLHCNIRCNNTHSSLDEHTRWYWFRQEYIHPPVQCEIPKPWMRVRGVLTHILLWHMARNKGWYIILLLRNGIT